MHSDALELAERLRELGCSTGQFLGLVVPVPRGLKIAVSPRHSWTEETALRSFRENADVDIGILVSGLFVLDFDTVGQCDEWAEEHPEIASAPAGRTGTGMHVFFMRCPHVDAAGLYNGPLVDPSTGDTVGVGRITISPSGAPNIVACPEWMRGRSLLESAPQKIVRFSSCDYYPA